MGADTGEAPELSHHPRVAVASEGGKSWSQNVCLRRFVFGFISSSPHLSILDCLRVWAGAGGEMGVSLEVSAKDVLYDACKGWRTNCVLLGCLCNREPAKGRERKTWGFDPFGEMESWYLEKEG